MDSVLQILKWSRYILPELTGRYGLSLYMKNCLNVIGELKKPFQTIVTMVIYKIHQAEQIIKYI